MDFGRVTDISAVNFALPPDHPVTGKLLKTLKPGKTPVRLYVGCAKWGRPDWIGQLYPKGTKSKDFLSYYTKYFNSIELNALFYSLQPKKIIEGWAATAAPDFRFCPKFSNSISHLHQLRNADADSDRFMDHMQSFGDKLGYSFLQLSDKFGVNRANIVQEYLEKLPKDFNTCLELRHPDWFIPNKIVDETFDLLRQSKIGTVITDTSGRRDCLHMKLTAPVAFIRYVGNNLHPTDFLRIDSWVDRINDWIQQGLREIYFFIHNHEEKNSPVIAKYAIEAFNKKCGLSLKVPRLLSDNELF